MEDYALQELMLATMPQWHYWMAKPFKHMLDENVSVGMYYCIQVLAANGSNMTMSELAKALHCSKQQMTKTVARLTECGLAERISDPADRRIIRLRLTEDGHRFVRSFLEEASAYYKPMLDRMTTAEQEEFAGALRTLNSIFERIKPSPADVDSSTTN